MKKIKIFFSDKIYHELIKICCDAVLKYENFTEPAEVSVTFCNNSEIHRINREFRNIDRPTDVLSFPLGDIDPDTNRVNLGDIIISTEKAEEQAKEYGHSLNREIGFLCVHSMLHLLGYDHVNNDAERLVMEKKQKEILDSINLKRE